MAHPDGTFLCEKEKLIQSLTFVSLNKFNLEYYKLGIYYTRKDKESYCMFVVFQQIEIAIYKTKAK